MHHQCWFARMTAPQSFSHYDGRTRSRVIALNATAKTARGAIGKTEYQAADVATSLMHAARAGPKF
jgi:hypothetical protein